VDWSPLKEWKFPGRSLPFKLCAEASLAPKCSSCTNFRANITSCKHMPGNMSNISGALGIQTSRFLVHAPPSPPAPPYVHSPNNSFRALCHELAKLLHPFTSTANWGILYCTEKLLLWDHSLRLVLLPPAHQLCKGLRRRGNAVVLEAW
jgi:hypothetical protein